jgi:hypothetical protein
MAKRVGGSLVKGGYYWNTRGWSVVDVPRGGGVLPGTAETRYVAVPWPLLLVILPVMGGLFVVFLPLIGFVLTIHAIAVRLAGGLKKRIGDLAATMHPGWTPGEAHLTGKPPKEGEKAEEGAAPAKDEALEKLTREIEEKRAKGDE